MHLPLKLYTTKITTANKYPTSIAHNGLYALNTLSLKPNVVVLSIW